MKSLIKLSALIGLVTGAALLGSNNVSAQATANVKATGWYKSCNDQDESKICNVQFRIVANNGNIVTGVSLIEITGKIKRRLFQVIVPTARSLPPGIEIRIDNKQGTKIPYAFCRPTFCVAEAVLNDQLVGILKAGGKMDIASVNYQGTRNPVPVTLKGFTAAYDGNPVKPQETVQSSQEKLKEQLQKKVESGEIKPAE